MRRLAPSLQLGGILAAVFGLSKLHAVAHSYDFTQSSRFAWSLAYAGLLAVAAYAAGLPDGTGGRSRLVVAIGAVASAAVAISLVQLALGSLLLPRLVVAGAGAVCVAWFVFVSTVARDTGQRAGVRDGVLLVAEPGEAEMLRIDLERHPERPAHLLDTVRPAEVADTSRGRPLVAAAERTGARVLVLSREATDAPQVIAQASVLHERGVRVRTLTGFYAEWLGKLPINEIERLSLMFDIREVHEPRYARTKRLLDLVLALPGLVALALVTPCVVLGNLVANRGPLLYRQWRVGRDGRRFSIVKFRTMRPGSTGDSAWEWAEADDPRVTPFGRVLRRSHVDELPQVLNILRGDLAVVGPRPEQPHYVEELGEKLPFYQLRHLVRPGLTGWAQVKYGYAGSERDALEKLQYEFFYLGRQSLRFDLRIIARTVRSVFGGDGR